MLRAHEILVSNFGVCPPELLEPKNLRFLFHDVATSLQVSPKRNKAL